VRRFAARFLETQLSVGDSPRSTKADFSSATAQQAFFTAKVAEAN